MDSKTWWIIIAIIVVVLILILIAVWQGKRRTINRRNEASELRQRAQDNEGAVVESRQRADTAAAEAERARAEAEVQQRRAQELQAEAHHQHQTAAAVQRDRDETLRRADRLDPDTPTDREGNRITGTGDGSRDDSAIDPSTGRPVEEAARQGDPRADRDDARRADRPDTDLADREGDRMNREGDRMTGTGDGSREERTIDPSTGRPAEEAGWQDDPRTDHRRPEGDQDPRA